MHVADRQFGVANLEDEARESFGSLFVHEGLFARHAIQIRAQAAPGLEQTAGRFGFAGAMMSRELAQTGQIQPGVFAADLGAAYFEVNGFAQETFEMDQIHMDLILQDATAVRVAGNGDVLFLAEFEPMRGGGVGHSRTTDAVEVVGQRKTCEHLDGIGR